jgi:hypothetical protein
MPFISEPREHDFQHRRRIVSREYPCRLVALVVRVVAVIAADLATVNSASALAGTWPSIQIKKSVRIVAGLADAPPVATPESSRLDFLLLDLCGCRFGPVSARRNEIAFSQGHYRFPIFTALGGQ